MARVFAARGVSKRELVKSNGCLEEKEATVPITFLDVSHFRFCVGHAATPHGVSPLGRQVPPDEGSATPVKIQLNGADSDRPRKK